LRPLQLAPSFTRFGLQNAGRRALLQTSPLFFTKSSYIPSSKKSDGLATRTFVRSFLRLADVNYKKQDQKLCSRHTSCWILPKIFRPARENLAAWHLEPSSAPLSLDRLKSYNARREAFRLTDLNYTTQDEKLRSGHKFLIQNFRSGARKNSVAPVQEALLSLNRLGLSKAERVISTQTNLWLITTDNGTIKSSL